MANVAMVSHIRSVGSHKTGRRGTRCCSLPLSGPAESHPRHKGLAPAARNEQGPVVVFELATVGSNLSRGKERFEKESAGLDASKIEIGIGIGTKIEN
jgi:hypothetical protein